MICRLDADDVFHPRKLEKILSALTGDPASGFCTHQLLPVTKTRKPIDAPILKALDHGWFGPQALRNGAYSRRPPASGLYFRRQVTDLVFPLSQRMRRGADAYLGGAAQFFTQIVALYEVLSEFRLHGDNITSFARPTASAVDRLVEDIRENVDTQRDFLEAHYGPAVADRLRIEDMPDYWDFLLELYVLEGQPQEGVHGHTADTLLSQLPQTPRERLWRFALALPPDVGRRVVYLGSGPSPWKRFARSLARFLRVKQEEGRE